MKQEESDIKSTGARNDYLLSLETANAHQDRCRLVVAMKVAFDMSVLVAMAAVLLVEVAAGFVRFSFSF